jgi:hypothetical protein
MVDQLWEGTALLTLKSNRSFRKLQQIVVIFIVLTWLEQAEEVMDQWSVIRLSKWEESSARKIPNKFMKMTTSHLMKANSKPKCILKWLTLNMRALEELLEIHKQRTIISNSNSKCHHLTMLSINKEPNKIFRTNKCKWSFHRATPDNPPMMYLWEKAIQLVMSMLPTLECKLLELVKVSWQKSSNLY